MKVEIIFVVVVIVLTIFYSALLFWFRKYWNKIPVFIPSQNSESDNQRFSILIAARNETNSIIACLKSITSQEYDTENFEIIVINDHSEDDTMSKVLEFISSNSAHQISIIDSDKNGKKQAITKGISVCKFDWIITTDADCIRGRNWLKTISAFIHENDVVMVTAPVILSPSKNTFEAMQALEFSGLIAIGAATLEAGIPTMCNGANLIFRKSVFNEVNGYEGNLHLASGDDEFLLHKVYEKYPSKVKYLRAIDATVSTLPLHSLTAFLKQRRRWVSKSTHYRNKRITLILILTYLFNLFLLVGFYLFLFKLEYVLIIISSITIKNLVEQEFLQKVGDNKFRRSIISSSSFLHIFYVVFIGIYGNFGSYNWKGRKVR